MKNYIKRFFSGSISADSAFSRGKKLRGKKTTYVVGKKLFSSNRNVLYHSIDEQSGLEKVVKQFSKNIEFRREKEIEAELCRGGMRHNILYADEFLDQELCMVMPYIKGKNLLAASQEAGKLTPKLAAQVIAGLCDALEYMHSLGIIHRDVKSANILLEDNQLYASPATVQWFEKEYLPLKLFDFEMSWTPAVDHLELPNAVCGTEGYISPEAQKGKKDLRRDIYAAGVILYELLTRQDAFRIEKKVRLGSKTFQFPDPKQYNHAVTPAIKEVIERSLAHNPDERYQSAVELKDAFLNAV